MKIGLKKDIVITETNVNLPTELKIEKILFLSVVTNFTKLEDVTSFLLKDFVPTDLDATFNMRSEIMKKYNLNFYSRNT